MHNFILFVSESTEHEVKEKDPKLVHSQLRYVYLDSYYSKTNINKVFHYVINRKLMKTDFNTDKKYISNPGGRWNAVVFHVIWSAAGR